MTNLAIIENKISSVKKYLKIARGYRRYSRKEIEENVDIRGTVERYLYLACQATIELAEALIAFRDFRKPTTMSENFYILNEEGVIPQGLTAKLVGMVGFRNVIAHDYEKINYELVYDVLQNKLKDLEEFLKIVEESIK